MRCAASPASRTRPERQRAAVRAVVAAGLLVLGFALVGRFVLDYLHVSVDSLSIAGGLLLLLVALEMLRGTDTPSGEDETEDVALVPLATPFVAGPGTIATVMVFARENPETEGRIAVIAAIVLALIIVGVVLLVAERVTRRVSTAILSFVTRVFGLLLSAIAVQLVVDGVRGLS